MSEKSIVPIELLVSEMAKRTFRFIVKHVSTNGNQALFSVKRLMDSKRPFEMVLITRERRIDLVIPGVAKADALSLPLCAIAHTNFDCFLGRFGWDPEDGEIRFESEFPILDRNNIDADATVDGYLELLPPVMRMFYIGLGRIISTQLDSLPSEAREPVIAQFTKEIKALFPKEEGDGADASPAPDEEKV